jgi:hypothetical protein
VKGAAHAVAHFISRHKGALAIGAGAAGVTAAVQILASRVASKAAVEAAAHTIVRWAAANSERALAFMEDATAFEQGFIFGCASGLTTGALEAAHHHWKKAAIFGGAGGLSCVAVALMASG